MYSFIISVCIYIHIYISTPKTQPFVLIGQDLFFSAVIGCQFGSLARSSLRRCCNAWSAPLRNAVGMANPTRCTIMIEALLLKKETLCKV